MFYASVILPIAGGPYTFSVQDFLTGTVKVGSAVGVQFGGGKGKPSVGIVRNLTTETPDYKTIKTILALAHPTPIVSENQLRLWEWMASYYMCTVGEVMRCALPAMFRKGDFTPYKRRRRSVVSVVESSLPLLTGAQEAALDGLRETFGLKSVALFFGAAASGKSEVAFHLAAQVLAKGRDVLILLPEISLAEQVATRAREIFGERVMLFHTSLSEKKRAEIYLQLLSSRPAEATPNAKSLSTGRLIVATRAGLLLPSDNLGLVVVDEEQDSGHKQTEPAPRFNARDVAIMAAQNAEAKVLLVSSTPSLETWMNATTGKYGLVRLTERYGGSPPPEVVISDTLRSAKRGERKSHFNKELLDRIAAVLQRGEQAIVFQNLRGATAREVADELLRLFPSVRIARFERDDTETARRKILENFERGGVDILVSADINTDGLDFSRVSLTGILNADNLLARPDFRASERAFQHLSGIASRSGRRGQRGQVVIQTADPDNRLIRQAAAGDFEAMAADVLAERAAFGYPPYSRIIRLALIHTDRTELNRAALKFGAALKGSLQDVNILGPEIPLGEKVRGQHASVFVLKIPRTLSMADVKNAVFRDFRALTSDAENPGFRRISLVPNVDPQ